MVIERVVIFRAVEVGDRRARLHRIRHQAVVGDLDADNIGRLGEGVVDRLVVTDRPVIDDVAGRFGVQLRRTGRDRRPDVADRR